MQKCSRYKAWLTLGCMGIVIIGAVVLIILVATGAVTTHSWQWLGLQIGIRFVRQWSNPTLEQAKDSTQSDQNMRQDNEYYRWLLIKLTLSPTMALSTYLIKFMTNSSAHLAHLTAVADLHLVSLIGVCLCWFVCYVPIYNFLVGYGCYFNLYSWQCECWQMFICK